MRLHLLLLPLLPIALDAAVYQAPSPEPTADEVQIVELMNRFRADPKAEAARILALKGQYWHPADVDWTMFQTEMAAIPAQPPLVIDLEALASARRHSFYMIHNGLCHDEVEGKEGFVAKGFAERMKAAGFGGAPGGENCFRDSKDAVNSHFGFIVDFGKGGPGGMQPDRGHRTNMARAGINVVGAGAVPLSDGKGLSVTHNLGTVKGRFAGGVVYVDKNRNGAFDPGEGRGGVTVATADGKATTLTWASGGFTLRLPGEAATAVVVSNGAQKYQVAAPAGSANVALSWAIPPEEDLKQADKMISEVEAIADTPANQTRRFKALVNLHLATAVLCLDPPRAAKVQALTGAVAAQLAEAKTAVLAAADLPDAAKARPAVDAGLKTFAGTAAEAWFKEGDTWTKAATAVANVEKTPERFTPKQRLDLMGLIGKARDACALGEWKARYTALQVRVAPLADPENKPRR